MGVISKLKQKFFGEEKEPIEGKEDCYDLAESIHTQILLFKFEKFLSKNAPSKKYSKKFSKTLHIIRLVFVYIYSLLIFFEKPFHCYKRTTFYKNKKNPENKCNKKLQYMYYKLFINVGLYRGIELVCLIVFVVIQFIKLKMKRNPLKFTKKYIVMEKVLIGLICICILDIMFGLCFDYFPLFNFFLRGIIIIMLVKDLRKIWLNIIYLFFATWNVFFLLFAVIICFGILGYFLFNYSEDFNSVSQSIYSLYILLSTCNFPDVMLGTFTIQSKSSIIFFIIYLIINYFIIFSLLKSLYYSEFFEIFRTTAKNLVHLLLTNQNDKLVSEQKMQNKLAVIKNSYLLTDEEYECFIATIHNYKNLSEDKLKEEIDYIKKITTNVKLKKQEVVLQNKILIILSNKYIELFINITDLLVIMFLFSYFKYDKLYIIIIQLIWCLLFVGEFLLYIRELKKKILELLLIKNIFYIINLLTTLFLLIAFIFNLCKINKKSMNRLSNASKPLIICRLIRVVLIIRKFEEFNAIFTTLKNMRNIFAELITTLYTFFFLFSTLSMFLTGGKITIDAFDDALDIPNNYVHINFNDFGSSFLSCFCLTMINNINIIARSLSYKCKESFKAYFATFYFMSTLIILNICQTLLLEMYLVIKSKNLI